jgi:hypothetical protein
VDSMRLRALISYRVPSTGRVRRIRLYAAYCNMRQRVAGTKTAGNGRSNPWRGLPMTFESWPAFRAWSLAHGYSRERCSLERIKPELGYGPDNCEWITRAENTRRARALVKAARREQIRAELGRIISTSKQTALK